MNYLQQNIGKLQAGGMPQTGIDPQMLAQMMSAQGAGQGVDFNGEPTPNVSGEPSFADMAQEIQGRYDKLIIPLQNKLEKLKEKLKEGVIVLASDTDGKVNLMVMATDEAQKSGAHAGNLVKAIAALVGGGGGGRPNMAQAGGKNPAGIDDCLKKAAEVLAEQLK